MKVTRWWWIRHAPVTTWKGRCYGTLDVPADVSNRAAFEGLAALLPDRARLVTSGLSRALDTARAIHDAGRALPEPEIVDDLREQCFGDWQGKTNDELESRYGRALHRFWRAPAEETPPNGESFASLMTRVHRAIETIGRRHQGSDIIAVAHGGTIRAALALALGIPGEAALQFSCGNLSVTRLDHIEDGRLGNAWRVAVVNQPPLPVTAER